MCCWDDLECRSTRMGQLKEQLLYPATTVDREIFVLKIFRALKFHGAKFS